MKKTTTPPKAQMPKVVEDCHELLRWLIPHLDKFPRNRRFTLGERLETELLEVLAACVSAAYAKRKQTFLEQASQRLAVAQHLWRLAYELQTILGQRYQVGSKQLVSLGAQVGGWLKLARQAG
ncbi:MAG: diversity-generating retroelement protein Avd [Gammaproteobacteria bacterium]|nr:diversity-generating retroelement protein Avd [Gammaproteobacteria bacterium]